jgi:mandelamide amidase
MPSIRDAVDAARASQRELRAYISVVDDAVEDAPDDAPEGAFALAVKDNIDVAGMVTTAGTPAFADRVAEADASIVATLRDAGAVVIGKTNLHELAFGVTSRNAAYGPVKNPVDARFSAGGSSGGSAATVARGDVEVALSTDTGGSVTLPASFCGVVGFRPTTGRYPADGVVRLSSSRDTIGLHTRTAAQARRIDELLVPGAAAPPPQLPGVRLGLPRTRWQDLDPDVAAVTSAALDRLRAAGAELVEVEIPFDADRGEDLVLYEAPHLLEHRAGFPFAELAARIASPDVRRIAQGLVAEPVALQDYWAARTARTRLRRDYAGVLAGVDALLMPACPVLPPPLGVDDVVAVNGRLEPLFPTLTRNTGPGSVAGVPMLTLPAGLGTAGLPVGVTLEGGFFRDPQLLALGAAVADLLTP